MGKSQLLNITLLTPFLSVFILQPLSSYALMNTDIPRLFYHVAKQNNVPAEILYAVAQNESNTKLNSKNVKPWPWTLNVKGKSYFYKTRNEACLALQNFVKTHPLKNIDVGIAQVNIGWNGKHFFKSHCDGFEPTQNLKVATKILKNCYQKHFDWVSAAGCYHHPKGGKPALRYKSGIRQKLAKLAPLTSDKPTKLYWVAPKHSINQPETQTQDDLV